MKKGVIHIIGFSIVFIVLFMILEMRFYDKSDVTYTWERVQNIEEKIDVMLLGNSHGFTSTNLAVLDSLWGINVESFASSSENMDQVMIHLEQALKYNKPEVIVLEVNAALLGTRETLQTDSLGVLLTDLDGMENRIDKLMALLKTVKWKNIPEGMFQLLRPVYMWTRFEMNNKDIKYSDTHGFVAKGSYLTSNRELQEVQQKIMNVNTCGEMYDYNEQGLKAFFDTTEKMGIPVILYKAPVFRSGGSEQVNTIYEIAKNYDHILKFIDYRKEMIQIGLKDNDFYDEGHLNRAGAEKFTKYLAEDFSAILGVDNQWENVWAYEGESVERTPNGEFRYSMDNYSKDVLFKFELKYQETVIDETDYSEDNVYLTNVDINEEGYDLYCTMIPKKSGDDSKKIRLAFMKKNTCVLESEE